METILVHPENQEQVEVIKAFFKALKIKFEFRKTASSGKGFTESIVEEKGTENEENTSEDLYILTAEQKQKLEQSRSSIRSGNFKTNDQIKNEVATWLHSL